LLHLIDATSENIKHDYLTIIKEIEAYDSNLSEKKQIIVLTKTDAVKEQKLNFAKEQLKKLNVQKVFGISSVSGENITKLVRQLQELITSMKKIEDDEDHLEEVSSWSP
jgi:GTP-binding protein